LFLIFIINNFGIRIFIVTLRMGMMSAYLVPTQSRLQCTRDRQGDDI